tara:strand:- start:45 stop:653 length:609 start_codon:yes stop_codon:yes gene_type:complete
MRRLNKQKLKRKFVKILVEDKGGKAKSAAYKQAKIQFEKKKREMLSAFDNHPVTREIQAGPTGYNMSGTLGGYGNLYSFIGFDAGTDPISPVRLALQVETRLIRKAIVKKKSNSEVECRFEVKMPTKESLAKLAPMPWEPGSWLLKIERGISGLGYYIYKKYIEKSRSGSGIQSYNKIMGRTMYRRTSYISAILNTFKKGLA